jgi:hypothetical protein
MSDASYFDCARCGVTEYACTCQNGFVKDEGISDTVYVAYQVDGSDYQSLQIRKEPGEIDSEKISLAVIESAKSCLLGWWSRISSELNEALASAGEIEGNLIAYHACFVVRITKHGWDIYEVKFTSEDMTESVVVKMPVDGGELPVAWPLFLARYL